MIPRYECREISQIWSDENRFQTYLQVELSLLKSLEHFQQIPKGTFEKFKNVKINEKRIHDIESQTHHDVIAFCTSITEQLDPDTGKFFHFGATSSDIIDTAVHLLIKQSLIPIRQQLQALQGSLKECVNQTQNTLCLGRSHGIWAEPMVFAQKWLGFYAECTRRLVDLDEFMSEQLTAQFSGAVGNYSILNHEVEALAAKELNLPCEEVSTQVTPRDRLAKLSGIFSLIAVFLERMAVEIRHLQHSDIAECAEGFKKGQKGSSTMPHKKNPVSSENITGMARMLKSYHQIALENCALWHERDISHSSAERIYLPDMLGLGFYAIRRMDQTIKGLVFFNENIENKVKNHSGWQSSIMLHSLIQNTDLTREAAYTLVQEQAFKLSDSTKSLRELLIEKNPEWTFLPQTDFESLKTFYIERFEKTKQRAFSMHQQKENVSKKLDTLSFV
jgi:adenylosuccinate lyase